MTKESEIISGVADQKFKAYELFSKGYKKTAIAKILGVHRNTIAGWIQDVAKEVVEEHMGTSAIELFTQELAKLAELESQVSRDLAIIDKTKGELYTADNEPVPAAIIDAHKSRLFAQKTAIIQQRMKMLQDCGAIPKSPEGMRKAMEDYQVSEEEQETKLLDVERSNEEIDAEIAKMLQHSQRIRD